MNITLIKKITLLQVSTILQYFVLLHLAGSPCGGLPLYFFLRSLNITIAFCTNGKRNGDSDHSEGSPSKRSRPLDNEVAKNETNVNLTSEPVNLQDVAQNAPNITPQNITLKDVANTTGIYLPSRYSTTENLEQNVLVSTSTLEKIDKSLISQPFQQKEIQTQEDSLSPPVLEGKNVKDILGIDEDKLEEILKKHAKDILDTTAETMSILTTFTESVFISSVVQTITNKIGVSKNLGKALGATTAGLVLLTNDHIKGLVNNFCNYQIKLICSPTPQDPTEKPPSPPNSDQFAGDVILNRQIGDSSCSVEPRASSNVELQRTVIDASQQSTKNEIQQDPSDNIMIPSVFEETYFNTDFLFSLGVQVTVFLLISIVVNENKAAIYKSVQRINKKISKYSFGNLLSNFMLNLVDNFILFHPIWVRIFCCITIIIIFTLLR